MASMGRSPHVRSSPGLVIPAVGQPSAAGGPYGTLRSASALAPRTSIDSIVATPTTTAVKCEVMIQHLRQRQMERLWTDGDVTEGVVLRRAKNDFICQPPELQQQAFGCYDEIRKLNVKVRCVVTACEWKLTQPGCNDRQDCRNTNIPEGVQPAIRPPQQWSAAASTA